MVEHCYLCTTSWAVSVKNKIKSKRRRDFLCGWMLVSMWYLTGYYTVGSINSICWRIPTLGGFFTTWIFALNVCTSFRANGTQKCLEMDRRWRAQTAEQIWANSKWTYFWMTWAAIGLDKWVWLDGLPTGQARGLHSWISIRSREATRTRSAPDPFTFPLFFFLASRDYGLLLRRWQGAPACLAESKAP